MIRTRAFFGAVVAAVIVLTGLVAGPAEAGVATASAARPANGKILFTKDRSGLGVLKIKNGNTKDAIVTLVRGKTKVVSLYIRAKNSASISAIDDGTYRVYYTAGYRYSGGKHRFTKSAIYRIFDTRLRYVTTSTTFTRYTLTLYVVKGGNAKVSPVDPRKFP